MGFGVGRLGRLVVGARPCFVRESAKRGRRPQAAQANAWTLSAEPENTILNPKP